MSLFLKGLINLLIMVLCQLGFAQQAFITTWKTDNDGSSGNTSITIPINPDVVGYSYDVDWDNDGTFDEFGLTEGITHNFLNPGTYTIRIKGDFPAIFFDDAGDKEKILDVSQWGDIKWKTFRRAFHGCSNLNISATDAPDLSLVRDLSTIFAKCTSLNSNINHWDVGNVQDLSGAFQNCTLFNQPLNGWNVSNVESMRFTFSKAIAFNQPLDNWDVSKVKSMSTLFSEASSFNQDISGWKFDSLLHIDFMFRKASSFNKPLNSWTFPKLTSLRGIFLEATSFNQDLSGWDVSKITNFSQVFSQASSFNQNLSSWNVSNGTDFSRMFNGALAFTGGGIENWNLGHANNTSYMFRGAVLFNLDISNWDLSKNKSTAYMFSQARIFNQNIGNWNLEEVEDMTHMFSHADLFNQDIGAWNTSKVKKMGFMFSQALVFNQDIGGWDVSEVEEMQYMFNEALAFNQNINSWDVASVKNMNHMFKEAILFNSPLDNWNTESLATMEGVFFAANVFSQDIGNWNVSEVISMYRVFRQANSFNQDVSNWDVSKVTNMKEMFYGANSFNQDLSKWNVEQVTNMQEMFFGATSFNQNLGGWNVSNLEEADMIFNNVPLSIPNYDSLLIGWASQDLKDTVDITANLAMYCLGKTARQNIIDTYNWTFSDAGLESTPPTAVCKDSTIYIPSSVVQINLDPLDIGEGSFDNCSSISLTLSKTTFTCKDTNLIIKDTLVVTDENGFQDFCISEITVLDTNSNLIINCQNDTVLFANQSNCSKIVNWKEPLVRCNIATIVSNFNSGDIFAFGKHKVEYTVTDNNGSSEKCSFDIDIISDLEVKIDSVTSPSCSNVDDGQVFVSTNGGVSPIVYDWDHDGVGDGDDNANEKFPSGTFILKTEDAIGCIDSDTVNIVTNSSEIIYCPNDTAVRANAPVCQGIVNWKEPIARCSEATLTSNFQSGNLLPLGTTAIVYTSTDLIGNQDVCEFSVQVFNDLKVSIDSVQSPSCSDVPDGSPFVSIDGGRSPFKYDWSHDGLGDADDTVNELLSTGDFTLHVIDNVGCDDKDSVSISTNSSVITFCPKDTAIRANNVGCSGIVNWNPPKTKCLEAILSSNFLPGDVLPLGTTTIKYISKDIIGNQDVCEFEVEIYNDLQVTIDSVNPPTCDQESDGQVFVTALGGSQPYLFDWDHDGFGDADDHANELLPAGKFKLKTIDKFGCVDLDSILITGNSADFVYCPNDTAIGANAAKCRGNVIWKTPVPKCTGVSLVSNFNQADILPLGVTTVKYVSTDLHGNQEVCEFNVTVLDDFRVEESYLEGPDCDDPESGKVILNTIAGYEPYSYHWNNDEYVLDFEDFNFAKPGINSVIAYDRFGCVDTLEVTVPTTLPLTLNFDTTVNKDTVHIKANVINGTNPMKYQWNIGSSFGDIKVNSKIRKWYVLQVTDRKNCTVTDSIYINENGIGDGDSLYIPNVFTPNGDSINDTWVIGGIENYEVVGIYIYNRWGGVIYSDEGNYTPWDGTGNGEDAPDGIYYYFLRLGNEKDDTYSGFVVISR